MYLFFIGPALLPITPAALSVSIGGNNKVVTLINDGEINIMHDPKLKEVSFDVLLPTSGQKYPFATYSLCGFEAGAFKSYFELLQARKIPFPFIVVKIGTGSILPKGYEYIQSVIESIEQKEDASAGQDMIITLKLREYREYATIYVDATEGEDGKISYKAVKQRGKSFTSEVTKLIEEVSQDIKGVAAEAGAMFGL